MSKILIICFILITLFPIKTSLADEYVIPEPDLNTFTVPQLVKHFSVKYNVSEEKMLNTMKCESGLNPKAKNKTSREYSLGIAQINLKAHTTITESQAYDPVFSAEWTAQQFALNKQSMWSCYQKLYK